MDERGQVRFRGRTRDWRGAQRVFLVHWAFDNISAQTPTVLQLLTAYKCDHLGQQFETADGLHSAFKLYWERCIFRLKICRYLLFNAFTCRVHGIQGEFWWCNPFTKEWEGNPVFNGEYQAYFKSLKNRDTMGKLLSSDVMTDPVQLHGV